MGSDESHFNVSLIVRDKATIKTVSTDHNLFAEKGKPKRIRTEALLLTSLTPYRWAKPAHKYMGVRDCLGPPSRIMDLAVDAAWEY